MKKPTATQEIIGPASLLTVGALYGLSAVIAKYLSGYIDPYQVVEYRFGIAFIGALLFLVLLKQKFYFKHTDKKVLIAFAITFPASAILFTLSIFHASVALAVFSFYTANLVAQFVLGRLFFGEKIDRMKKLAFLFTILALIAFTNPFNDFSVTLGLVYGLTSGVIQGVASSFQKLLSNSTNKSSLLIVQAFAGFAMALIILLATGRSVFPHLDSFEWLVTIAFGLSMLAIMYLFLVGYKYTNLNVGSILVSSELLFAPLFAFLLLSEHLSTNIFIGGIFTVIAAILANVPPSRLSIRKVPKPTPA
jgi:drug/metabolite transporter (DMT)-like permease